MYGKSSIFPEETSAYLQDIKDVLKKIKDKQKAHQLIVWYQVQSCQLHLIYLLYTHVQSILCQ